jgi:hypothetical protein
LYSLGSERMDERGGEECAGNDVDGLRVHAMSRSLAARRPDLRINLLGPNAPAPGSGF